MRELLSDAITLFPYFHENLRNMPEQDINVLLERIRANEPEAESELLSQIYDELRRMAASLMRKEFPGHTLQGTAVVNEAVVLLLGKHVLEQASDQHHLFASIHMVMRHVLIDHARRRKAKTQSGSHKRVPLDGVLEQILAKRGLSDLELLAIDESLQLLEQRSSRQRSIVELKIFSSLSNREVAEQLGIAEPTVERDFRLARAFLSQQLARLTSP
jgi:RNA polymerase sigma factor (TIGR02999 family)